MWEHKSTKTSVKKNEHEQWNLNIIERETVRLFSKNKIKKQTNKTSRLKNFSTLKS